MQRLRVRYAKRGRARFASHRDFSRAFERALRRAGVPMAYSSGFNPHPRIAYANASPTGAATEAEYLEIGLRERRDADAVRLALDAALPEGMHILEVVEAGPGSLAQRLTASEWRLTVPGVPQDVLAAAVGRILAAHEVAVERMTKNGLRGFDARGAILSLRVVDDETLELVSRQDAPLVRPDDVLQALGRLHEGFVAAAPPLFTRLSQGEWVGGRVVGPFEARRED